MEQITNKFLKDNGFLKVGASWRKSLSENLELCLYPYENCLRFQTKGSGFSTQLKGYSKDNLILLIKG